MLLEKIAELVAQLELSGDPDELCAALRLADQLQARIALGAAAMDAAGSYLDDAAVSAPAWLRSRGHRPPGGAARLLVTGTRLAHLPVLRAAVLEGSISGGQLEVILACIPARHLELFAGHEPAVVPELVDLDVDGTRRAMQHWLRHADALDPGAAPAQHDDEVRLAPTLNGGGDLRGWLSPDLYALAVAALRLASPQPSEDERSLPQRQADGLAQILQHFLDHQQTASAGRHRPHVSVVIDHERFVAGLPTGRYLETDQPVAPSDLSRLLCDGALHRLLWDQAAGIVDYGRSTRQWSANLAEAITIRDGGCRFPGCDARASWCDIHHLRHWEDGGPTSVDNGAIFCRRHHRMVHALDLELELRPDGTLDVTWPDSTHGQSAPRGPLDPTLWPHHREPVASGG